MGDSRFRTAWDSLEQLRSDKSLPFKCVSECMPWEALLFCFASPKHSNIVSLCAHTVAGCALTH